MSLEVLDYTGLQNYNLAEVKDLGGRNLLINGDFQINQRGKTQYVSSTVPILTVDMWATNLLTVDVLEKGIKITNNDSSRHSVYQKGLNLPKNDYTISLNVLEKTGTPTSQPFVIYYYDEEGEYHYVKEIDDVGIFSVSFNNSISQVAIGVPANCTLTLEYVDLFEGSIAYPHVKEDRAIALSRCQEWLVVINGAQYMCCGFGQFIDKTQAYMSFHIPSTLRAIPTMTGNGQCLLCSRQTQNSILSANVVGVAHGFVFVIITITEQMPIRELTAYTDVTGPYQVIFTCEPK